VINKSFKIEKEEPTSLSSNYKYIIYRIKETLMEINLNELMAIQSALITVKMHLTQERKTDPDKLKKIVDEAYEKLNRLIREHKLIVQLL
jgi:hypothetical protein